MTKFMFDCKVEYVYELFEKCKYPWEILLMIKDTAQRLVQNGLPGFSYLSEGVLVGKNVEIAENVTIIPPAIIGDGTVLRPGAFLRGNVITGRNCVIGNSSELKNCLLLDVLTPSGPSSHARHRADAVLMGVIPFRGVVVTGNEIGRQGLGLLIGMDIISKGDYATICKDRRTRFTF